MLVAVSPLGARLQHPGLYTERGDGALGLGLKKGQVQALETMASAFWAGHSQNRPPGQGTQMGRGLQVVRTAAGPQETAGRQGRHDLAGEWSGAHGLPGSLRERESSGYGDFPIAVFNSSEHFKNHLVLPPCFTNGGKIDSWGEKGLPGSHNEFVLRPE